jgi:hypothetical protein
MTKEICLIIAFEVTYTRGALRVGNLTMFHLRTLTSLVDWSTGGIESQDNLVGTVKASLPCLLDRVSGFSLTLAEIERAEPLVGLNTNMLAVV